MAEINGKNWITVREFATKSGRYKNQIYDLIIRGNKYGCLQAVKLEGSWLVLETELTSFPFNEAVKVAQEKDKEIGKLKARIKELECRM